MKVLVIVLGVLLLLLVVAWIAGALLPREHSVTCRATFRAAPAALFARLVDVEAFPSWRPEVRSVELLGPAEGKRSWREDTKFGKVAYVEERREQDRALVLRIADDTLPYGGTWTFALEPEGTGTRLAITEDGFVRPALFRLLARFVFGYHATLKGYLEHLGRALGEDARVELVAARSVLR